MEDPTARSLLLRLEQLVHTLHLEFMSFCCAHQNLLSLLLFLILLLKLQCILFNGFQKIVKREVANGARSNNNSSELTDFEANLIDVAKFALIREQTKQILPLESLFLINNFFFFLLRVRGTLVFGVSW